jgi:hypothetical protein
LSWWNRGARCRLVGVLGIARRGDVSAGRLRDDLRPAGVRRIGDRCEQAVRDLRETALVIGEGSVQTTQGRPLLTLEQVERVQELLSGRVVRRQPGGGGDQKCTGAPAEGGSATGGEARVVLLD